MFESASFFFLFVVAYRRVGAKSPLAKTQKKERTRGARARAIESRRRGDAARREAKARRAAPFAGENMRHDDEKTSAYSSSHSNIYRRCQTSSDQIR